MTINPRHQTDYKKLKEPHLNYLALEAKGVAERLKSQLDIDKVSDLFKALVFKELSKLAPKAAQPEPQSQPVFDQGEEPGNNGLF